MFVFTVPLLQSHDHFAENK